MSSVSAQKGKGFFQDLRKRVLNTFSGRKTIRKQLLKPRSLSAENQKRKQTLTRKLKKSKEEKQELSVLTSKQAPKEDEYKAQEKRLLEARSEKQKGYNKFYNKKVTVYYPVSPYPFYRGNDRREGTLNDDDLELMKHISDAYKNTKKELSYDSRTGVPVDPATGVVVNIGPGGDITPTAHYPEIAPTPPEFITTGSFPFENILDGRRRIFAYLHDVMTGVDTRADGYIFLTKHATPQQMVDLSSRCIQAYNRHAGDLNAIAEDLFHLPLEQLDDEILRMEKVRWVLPTASDPSKFVVGETFGTNFDRYISSCMYPRSTQYQFDESQYQCTALTEPGMDERPPIQSFDSPRDRYLCIGCFGDMEHFLRWRRRDVKGISNYIILHPKYLPIPEKQAQRTDIAVRIQAGGFLHSAFIEDAFKEQAVDTMDEDLFNLVRKKAPKLLESSKVILATLPYLKTTPFQTLFTERFLLLAEDSFPEGMAITYRNPLLVPEVNSALKRNRGFLLCDPYTAYCTKKKEPQLWSETFGARFDATGEFYNVAFSVYSELNEIEKFLVDFYQFAFLLERLQLRNNSGLTNEKLMQASDVYKMPINAPEFVEFIKENSGPRDEMFKEFLKMQKLITTYAKPIASSSDVFRFLQKFSHMPVSFPGTNVNIENIAYLNRYFQQKRFQEEGRVAPAVEVVNERPRVSERPVLSLRRPLDSEAERLARLQSQLLLRKSERNVLLRKYPVLYNSQARRRRTRNNVSSYYNRVEATLRNRMAKQRMRTKRNAAMAQWTGLQEKNVEIEALERQIARLAPLPASPPASPSGSLRTVSSNNNANLPPFGTVA